MTGTRDYKTAQEPELIEWASDGDDKAFRRLVDPHRSMIHAVCFRIVGHEQDAQDAVQNTLLAAWQHLGRFQQRSKFSTWLYRIAYNAALASIRKRVPEPVGGSIDDATAIGLSSETVDEVHAVRWALAKIPTDFRAALVLREYCDMSYEEIAETQGIKLATVKTRISRARQAVAALLESAEA